jgi:uncharacterized membrane protein (DUF373 family)
MPERREATGTLGDMANDQDKAAHGAGRSSVDDAPDLVRQTTPRGVLARISAVAETALLQVVSLVLLAVGAGVLVAALVNAVTRHAGWTETLIGILEEMLLVLIIVEFFITVQAHLHGRRLQLEPFIVVGIIALVRHILSTVVRLSVPETPAQTHQRLTELAVDGGAAFLLVLALALNRWSQHHTSR